MNNVLILAVDAGKSFTKAIYKNNDTLERFLIRTKVKEVVDFGVDIHDGSYLVEFEGKSYIIGNMLSEAECSYDVSKTSLSHKIAIYTAIALAVKKTKINHVKIAIGAPLNIYKNNTLKENYSNYIRGENNISIKIDDELISFIIDEILILPESIGPIYKDITKYKDKNAVVFDIGGLNVNISSYRKRIPELDKMVVCNKGINILRSVLSEELSAKYGLIIDDGTSEDILKEKIIYINGIPKESKEFIDAIINNHLNEIINYSKSRGYNPFNSNSDVIFSGGGSILLSNNIKALYPTVYIENDGQFSNCLGFYNIGEIKLG